MYTTQFLEGVAEGRMVVSSLMKAGYLEEGIRKGLGSIYLSFVVGALFS